jgi:hypothetical protein
MADIDRRFRQASCLACLAIALMMEATNTSETSVNFYQTQKPGKQLVSKQSSPELIQMWTAQNYSLQRKCIYSNTMPKASNQSAVFRFGSFLISILINCLLAVYVKAPIVR